MSKSDDEAYEFEDRKKRSLKERLFGGGQEYQERKYLEGISKKELREIEGISSGKDRRWKERIREEFQQAGTPGTPEYKKWKAREDAMLTVPRYIASTEAAKLVGTIGKEAVEYVPRKLREAREDIETEREYRGRYGAEYRKHRLTSAEARAKGTEQRHYREKVGKETEKIEREKALKDIVVSEEKAYRVARASQAGRERAKKESGRYAVTRPQIARPQLYGISQQPVIVEQPRYRIYNPFTAEAARALDPTGIYSLRPPRQQQTQQTRQSQFQQQMPQQSADMSWMNFLLGYGGNPRSGKRKPVYNIFTGVWE